MSLDVLKGKKVHSIETHKHHYYYYTNRIKITFQDGTILNIHAHNNKVHTEIKHGEPPQEEKLPWIKNEKDFFEKLSDDDQIKYLEARKAFFWLIENKEKVENHFSFFDKTWRESRRSFSMQVNMDANNQEDILNIFFSSSVAPECDDWFALGKKRDWKRIIDMQKEVVAGCKS